MRAVAAELGVQAAALYRYVASREELDDLVFDHLMAGCLPKVVGRDWREDLRQVVQAWRRRLLERRDATRIVLGHISVGPNIAPLIDAVLNALRRAGLDGAAAAQAYETLLLFVHGFASTEAVYRRLAPDPAAQGRRWPPLRPEWARSYPDLVALADRFSGPGDFEAIFAFGLEALIEAIARRAEARPDATTQPS